MTVLQTRLAFRSIKNIKHFLQIAFHLPVHISESEKRSLEDADTEDSSPTKKTKPSEESTESTENAEEKANDDS